LIRGFPIKLAAILSFYLPGPLIDAGAGVVYSPVPMFCCPKTVSGHFGPCPLRPWTLRPVVYGPKCPFIFTWQKQSFKPSFRLVLPKYNATMTNMYFIRDNEENNFVTFNFESRYSGNRVIFFNMAVSPWRISWKTIDFINYDDDMRFQLHVSIRITATIMSKFSEFIFIPRFGKVSTRSIEEKVFFRIRLFFPLNIVVTVILWQQCNFRVGVWILLEV
jgi:hypothetical protein